MTTTQYTPSTKAELFFTSKSFDPLGEAWEHQSLTDEFDPDEITRIISVEPTGTRRKRDYPPNGLAHTVWCCAVKREYAASVSDVLRELIERFKSKTAAIIEAESRLKLRASFVVTIHAAEGDLPEISIPGDIIGFMSKIGAELDFDIYCYEQETE